jgi:hypothetical protein
VVDLLNAAGISPSKRQRLAAGDQVRQLAAVCWHSPAVAAKADGARLLGKLETAPHSLLPCLVCRAAPNASRQPLKLALAMRQAAGPALQRRRHLQRQL